MTTTRIDHEVVSLVNNFGYAKILEEIAKTLLKDSKDKSYSTAVRELMTTVVPKLHAAVKVMKVAEREDADEKAEAMNPRMLYTNRPL